MLKIKIVKILKNVKFALCIFFHCVIYYVTLATQPSPPNAPPLPLNAQTRYPLRPTVTLNDPARHPELVSGSNSLVTLNLFDCFCQNL